MKKSIYNKYLGLGFQLISLKEDKTPLKKRDGKSSDSYDADKIYGIVPPKKLMIIDVDVKKGKKGLESLKKLENDLMQDLTPSVKTGSGGLHIYVTINAPYRIKQKDYPDIDFICYKANEELNTPYAVAGGQTFKFKDTDGSAHLYNYTFFEDGITINKIEGLSNVLEEDEIRLNDDCISTADIYTKKTPAEVIAMLKWIDASDYNEWMANAAAIRRELGNTAEAFEIFHNWSRTADNYNNRDECLKKWKNVNTYLGKARTIGTIYKNALDNKTNNLISKINEAKNINELDEILNEDIWTQIPKFTSQIISKYITKTYQAKANKLDVNVNYNNAQKKTKILHGKDLNDVKIDENDVNKDDLLDDFVKVATFRQLPWFQISNNARHDLDGATRLLGESLDKLSKDKGLKKTLTLTQAFQKKLIKYATGHEYNPTTNARVFTDETGKSILNLFDINTIPKESEFTEEGKRLIKLFVKHLENITSKKEANVLLDWMAYLVQNKGKRVIWVPLIQSIEGAGKSVIGNLLINHVFGKANAGVVDPIVAADTNNNSWACGKMLRVLEEIKITGHNRYEVINNLKSIITNSTISRKEKFEVSSEVTNTCNFIAFTNYKDALPLDDKDRRWWLVFSPIDNLNELEKISGKPLKEYFEPLYELAEPNSAYGTEFRTFLLERDIKEFNPKFAPKSTHKEELKEIERGKLQFGDEIQDLINFIYKTSTPKVIDVRLIRKASTEALNEDGRRFTAKSISGKDIRYTLQKLGYKTMSKKTYKKADWTGVSPMLYNCTTTEAIEIWEKAKNFNFIVEDFDNLDCEL